jgi:hypothetical protein
MQRECSVIIINGYGLEDGVPITGRSSDFGWDMHIVVR